MGSDENEDTNVDDDVTDVHDKDDDDNDDNGGENNDVDGSWIIVMDDVSEDCFHHINIEDNE